MKIKSLLFFFCAFICSQTKGQEKTKTISINGFSLCQASIAELRHLDPNLKEVKVQEMDHPVECFGEDSRFENGKGYYSSKYPGIIFQKEQTSDIISKIRLTKEFKGTLPDGTYVDMQNLSAKDVLNKYPKFDTWGSRDCSDYWSLSNDTLSFYVKIDKKPRYPVDEKYYLEKPIESIDLVISCYRISEENEPKKSLIPIDPVIFIDSVRVTKNELQKVDPKQVEVVTIYKDKAVLEKFGPEAVNGLVYVETKDFAKKRLWNFLSSKSTEYQKLVSNPFQDSDIVYILNKRVLNEKYYGGLYSLTNQNFIDLKILTSAELKSDFNISDKIGGVVITSKPTEKNKE